MTITVAHSPDSDDAFMFYGLASGQVETYGLEVDHVLQDIETLNRAAFEGTYDVTAVSFHAYTHLTDTYLLLPHGSSMGDQYGPIVVAREGGPTSTTGVVIAVPGELTTAFLVLRLYDPNVKHVVMPFDQIQDAVTNGEVEAGLLIHEGQLSYGDRGLKKIVDLGVWWAERTDGLPLPLGGNVIRRDFEPDLIIKVSKMLHDSIAYALNHREKALDYALQWGRGLDRGKVDMFVGMYVNGLTLDYGDRGRIAVQRLFDDAWASRLIPKQIQAEFSA